MLWKNAIPTALFQYEFYMSRYAYGAIAPNLTFFESSIGDDLKL